MQRKGNQCNGKGNVQDLIGVHTARVRHSSATEKSISSQSCRISTTYERGEGDIKYKGDKGFLVIVMNKQNGFGLAQ